MLEIVISQQSAIRDTLRARLDHPDIRLHWIDDAGQSTTPLDQAQILFRQEMPTAVLETVLRSMPHLRWLHTASAGIDHVLPTFLQLAPPEAMLTNSAGTMARPIAEYVIGQMLAITKNFSEYVLAQTRHEWYRPSPPLPPHELQGANLLILGLGHIGRTIGQMAHALGVHTRAITRQPPNEPQPYIADTRTFDENWLDWIAEADFIVIALPLTDETRNRIDRQVFTAMKQTAWMINIARGAIVNEADLLAALQSSSIGGAVLDVTVTEPLPADDPLWSAPHCIITPHASWRSPNYQQRLVDLFVENVHRYQTGEPLINVIPRDRGY